MIGRTIIHLDLDAFFCAVEEQRDPQLRGVPFAVGGRPEGRGVVASCSYAARAFGVHSAMPMAQAVALCSGLIVVPPTFDAYRAASQMVMERLHALTPLVEQISIDEAFLDVSALVASTPTQNGETIARQLQVEIDDQLNLACSLGVASNKLVAKIATDIGKSAARRDAQADSTQQKNGVASTVYRFPSTRYHSPCAICVVTAGYEAAFLAPLPVSAMWGVGPKTAEKLLSLGITTIGDIVIWPEAELIRFFGKHGADLWRRAQGIDARPIETEHETKSISQETTFERDVHTGEFLRQTLREQATTVARKLRRKHLTGSTIKLKIRWPDFTTPTRQLTLPAPTDSEEEIAAVAVGLLAQTWEEGQPIRLIGVGVSSLGETPRQLGLWDAPPVDQRQQQNVRVALAAVRSRLGAGAVRRASEIERDEQ